MRALFAKRAQWYSARRASARLHFAVVESEFRILFSLHLAGSVNHGSNVEPFDIYSRHDSSLAGGRIQVKRKLCSLYSMSSQLHLLSGALSV